MGAVQNICPRAANSHGTPLDTAAFTSVLELMRYSVIHTDYAFVLAPIIPIWLFTICNIKLSVITHTWSHCIYSNNCLIGVDGVCAFLLMFIAKQRFHCYNLRLRHGRMHFHMKNRTLGIFIRILLVSQNVPVSDMNSDGI